jgi:eukaryotic-like serine/threonine-protein kinase
MSDDSLVGRRLGGRYRIEERVARGGMAHVYRARDERLDRRVAVKVLAAPYVGDPEYVERFLAEARTAASLSHPNLAHVYDSGTDGDTRFIVLELLEGYRSLRDTITTDGPLPPAEAVAIGRAILAGLAPLHEQGLVHCDVKSGNVLVHGHEVKLIDFGISRPLREASVGPTSIGSLHAMSPEQLRGEPLTAASDLFAVGVVLYEALTGRVPFPGETPAEVAELHDAGPPRQASDLAPGIGPRLNAAVLQALSRDPRLRFVSAAAMDHALGSALATDEAVAADEAEAAADETTTVVTVQPAIAASTSAPLVTNASPAPQPRRSLGGALTAFGGIAVLAMAGVLAVVIGSGLVDSTGRPGGASPGASSPASTQQSLPPGSVRVPDTIGMTEAEAEAAASAAGLNWRIEWRIVPGQDPGIYDQEPPAGRLVEAGARFVMYAYRTQ